MITQQRLKELINYDTDTGIFIWKKSGSVAGCLDAEGYKIIGIDGKHCKAHRLAWLYVQGSLPKDQIDHKNGIVGDNRLSNLREATPSQNMHNRKIQSNNSTGHPGVVKRKNKYGAHIKKNGKRIWLGTYDTIFAASAAYSAASKFLHGEYSGLCR